MIRGHAVAAQQRKILNVGRGLGLIPVDPIVEPHLLLDIPRHTETQSERLSRSDTAVARLARKLAHVGVKQPRALGGVVALSGSRREIAIRESLLKNRFSRGPMQCQAF